MRNIVLFGSALLFLLLGILSRFDAPNYRSETLPIHVDDSVQVILVSGLIHFDSLIITSDKNQRISHTSEYLDKNTITIFLDPSNQENPEKMRFDGLQRTNQFRQKYYLEFFPTYFDYFGYYDRYFFYHSSILGGIALLFSITLIVSLIAKIPLLSDFNLITLCALLLMAAEEYHIPFVHSFSWIGLGNLMLWVLLTVAQGIIQYFNQLNPILTDTFIWKIKNMLFGVLVLFFLVFFPNVKFIHEIIQAIEIVLLVFHYYLILKFNPKISIPFRMINWVGVPIFFIQWLQVFYRIFEGKNNIWIAFVMLVFLTVLAVLIARYILIEFRKSREINAFNARLQREIGQQEFISIENERRKLVDELNDDVLQRVQNLTLELSHPKIDTEKFEKNVQTQVQDTLNALRKYSYSLYPPYIEQLSLSDILQREIDQYKQRPDHRFHLLLTLENQITLSPIFKLWIYRVFKEYIHFFELSESKNHVYVTLELEAETRVSFILKYVIPEGGSPIYKSLNHSNVKTYIDYFGAQFSHIREGQMQGWNLKLDHKSFSN